MNGISVTARIHLERNSHLQVQLLADGVEAPVDEEHNSPKTPTSTSGASPFLGIGVLACIGGLVILFSGGSLGFSSGLAVGQLAGSGILALPAFLVWRFATKKGRSSPLGRAFNVFSFFVLFVWVCLFVIAKNLLPDLIADLDTDEPQLGAATAQRVPDAPERRKPLCKDFREAFAPNANCEGVAENPTASGTVSNPKPAAMSEAPANARPKAPPEILPHDRRRWSGNMFDQFDSVQDIEEKARAIPQLNEQRAWAAVIAWQAYLMAARGEEANVAMYMGVDQVLEGLRANKGICRPGVVVTADVADATRDIPVGSRFLTSDCDRSP